MEDEIKYLALAFLLALGSCTSYHKIESLYQKSRFSEAYALLQQQNPDSANYKAYQFKLAFLLVLEGDKNTLPLLDALLKAPPPQGAAEAHSLASAWGIYTAAKNNNDFKQILEIIPSRPLKDPFLEKVRLAMQSQSLLNLQRYKELVNNLEGKTGRNSELLYMLAGAYKGLGENDKALGLYEDVLRISESSVLKGLACFHSGDIYEQQQDTASAQKFYLQSWDYAAGNASLNFKLGRILSKGSYEALPQRFYRAALRLDENHAEAWYYLNMQ